MARSICTIGGCGEDVDSHGYCVKHLRRWQKWGDPHYVAKIQHDDVTRFHSKILVSDSGCWLWQDVPEANGYARFSVGMGRELAHRWSYEHYCGSIPEGMTIDHLCRVKHCVNPEHLEVVTQKVNNLRSDNLAALNARKVKCLRGHPFDSANTYVNPSTGARHCRRCAADRERNRRKALN